MSLSRSRNSELSKGLDEILEILHRHEERVDERTVREAFDLAMSVHGEHERKDGKPYMVHPLAVAHTCAEHWMTDVGVSAALLHDTLEDADKKHGLSEEVLERRFGTEVAHIVAGVTKLERKLGDDVSDVRAGTLKKLLLTTAREDIRIIILKIFDRHHNVGTLGVFEEDKRRRIGEETMSFYVPIAERLGFYKVARQMEDNVFRFLQPGTYDRLVKWIRSQQKQRSPEVMRRVSAIRTGLEEKGIDVVDNFYAKGVFTVYQMASTKDGGIDVQRLEEIPVFNLCLIVPDADACFRALNLVHAHFKFLPESVRDFVNNPKINGYQSIHSLVRGPGGSRITVIIRTPEMDWKNHQGVITDLRAGRVQEGTFLKDLVESFDIINSAELLELTGRLFFPEIDVTSPAGQTFKLPEGSTALDFAYHIHTDVGLHAASALIGGRERKLSTRLRTGQKVEIVKAREPQVTPAWMGWVGTDKARLAIRKQLSRIEREALQAETGRFLGYLKQKIGIGLKPDGPEMTGLVGALALDTEEKLGRQLFVGLVGYDYALARIVPFLGRRDLRRLLKVLAREGTLGRERLRELEAGGDGGAMAAAAAELIEQQVAQAHEPCRYVDIEGLRHNVLVRFALCCRPGFGDQILGVATRDRGITIHRQECGNVAALKEIGSVHLVATRWRQSPKTRRVLVQVEGTDRRNLLHDLTRVLSDLGINIVELSIRTQEGEWFGGVVLLEVSDLTSIDTLVTRFNAIPSLKVTDSWDLP